MYDNIVEDAQEIKKRLAALGEDADETVICELLKSFGPDYELDHIIGIITENWDSGFQNNSDEIIPVTDDKYKTQYNAEKVLKHIESTQRSSMDDACAETSNSSSDYDDGLDYYSSYWDDISVDTVTRSLPSPSELYGNTSSPNRSEAISVPPEVEFLEENNNDPNNNLDSVQMLHELQNNSSDVDNEKRNSSQEICVEFIEKPESPKPGCSKDSHDAFISQEDSKLHIEAEQISALLPRFKYSMIYKMLCQNSNAKNRIELTLWNLLSENKPKPEFLPKCKLSEGTCSMEQSVSEISKSNLEAAQHIHSKNSQPTGKRAITLDKRRKVKRSIIDTILDINQQGTIPITKAKLKKMDNANNDVNMCIVTEKTVALEADSNNKELKLIKNSAQKMVAGERRPSTAQSILLRPAKLTFASNISKISEPSSSTSTLNPILLPAKLKWAKIQRLKDVKPSETSTENLRTVNDLKQNINGECSSLNALTDGINKQTSGVNIADSHSSVSSVENVTVLQNKALSSIEVGETRLQESSTSHSLQSISTKDIQIITPKEVSSSEGEIKDILKEEEDINISQQAMPLPKVNITNVTGQSKSSSSLQLPACAMQHPTISYKQALVSHIGNKLKATYNCTSTNDKASVLIDLTLDNIEQGNAMISNVTNISNNSVDSAILSDKNVLCVETVDKMQVEQRGITNNVNNKIVLSQRALQIYYKLIPMFPCVDTNYIKRLCQNHIKDETELLDEAVLLQDLVEQLLDHGQEQPYVKKAEPVPVSNTFDVNEQYANLLGIFPEADPVYLRNIASEIYNDPDKMKQFVQSKLENPDYPTKEQYLTKKKITEQQKQYTTGFQVQQFLEIFPDPFTHFENQERKCQFNTDVVEFLKHHFNKIRVNTLVHVYGRYKHNLSLTAKYLEGLSPNMKSKRFYPLAQKNMQNIPLLQECAFIQHKTEITNYLAELKEKEEKEFNELKAKNALLECQCCFDNECMPSKCSTCEDGHIFCNSCIVKSTDVKLADGETHIHCLVNCNCEFPLSVLQQILSPTKFSILLRKRQEAEVMAAGLEGLVSCPFCHFASIPPQEDKVFKCFNPDCMKESCRLCKEINHLPLKCNEAKSDVARLYLEEKMTEALVRKCFRCTRTFFKEEGCNKMTCPCGAQMCYICDKPVTNYQHFRGQGDTTSNLCPLWSDDHRMNAEAVIKVCQETMKHIKEKNPQVEINTNALMPKLPPKRNGPHQDVARADDLPAHINRIMRQIP